MLRSVQDMRKNTIGARDGEIGRIADVLFDDRSWIVRYVVVDTQRWLPGRKVLVPRERFEGTDWDAERLDVDLTRKQIEEGPGLEADPPLAQEARAKFYSGLVWSEYPWGGFIGTTPGPTHGPEAPAAPAKVVEPPETHLRSAREIFGYRIDADDGRIGRVEDLVFSDTDWSIRYAAIATRNWLPGKKVAVPPQAVERMDWADQRARVARTKKEIRRSPELRTDGHRVEVGSDAGRER